MLSSSSHLSESKPPRDERDCKIMASQKWETWHLGKACLNRQRCRRA